ncbi:KAR9-domain-containing protein, partial [Aaosphaeria arxii CBS 175.79]
PSSVAASAATKFSPPPRSIQQHNPPREGPPRVVRKNVSPGLLARMKFLNQNQDTARYDPQIGRISEDKIRELDEFHRDRSVNVERRGTAWSGIGPAPYPGSQDGTPLIPQHTGESVPAFVMDQSPPPGFESDRSSFVSTSDRVLPSDSEASVLGEDTQKYRLPDISRSKSLGQAIDETASSTETELTRAPTPPPKDTPPLPQPTPPPVQAPPKPAEPEPKSEPELAPEPTPVPQSAPQPEAKEEVSVLDDNDGIDVAAYFHRRQFSRANSIYTLSRASFTNQLQQLTSITLPPAASLSSSISAIPTSTAAGRALHDAANQIKLWMAKATEVLNGLDAEDDVEWAAAAGREGLAEVDVAIGKFEGLVTVYITAIEDLQSRPDIAALPAKDLVRLVTQMEEVVAGWTQIKKTLKDIKRQVEIAMEWEELWNSVLGEIGQEVENLSRLVFEMEERRHRAISDSVAESAEKFDIAELETIVEETPRHPVKDNKFGLPPPPAILSPTSPIPQIEQENSRLLALFAKLQPLRASLDFLPMRLSSFHLRASKIFPSACDELMRRKDVLEKLEKKLEADADALREELGEDKWVHSFRQAGSKAVAMYDSLMKSIQRLRQAIDDNDEEKLSSRIATYKDKREHYPPSMKRVLELIDIEMKHRSTVNGEILRIQEDVRQKMVDQESEIKEMNMILDEFTATRKLRDSVSTVISTRTEASIAGSLLDTPNSSPASSVILTGRKSGEYGTTTPVGKKSRQPSASSSRSSIPSSRRHSALPTSSSVPRKAMTTSRLEHFSTTPSRAMSGTLSSQMRSVTPTDKRPLVKPPWNPSVNMRDTIVGHNFKPNSLTTPSPHRSGTPNSSRSLRSVSSHSSIPVRSPLSRSSAALSPPPHGARPASTTPAQSAMKRPTASTIQSPSTPARGKTPGRSTPASSSRLSISTPTSARQVAHQDGEDANEDSPSVRRQSRPPSAANSRRVSLLPTPQQQRTTTTPPKPTSARTHSRLGSIDEGRKSRQSRPSLEAGRLSRIGGRISSLGQTDDKPKWR